MTDVAETDEAVEPREPASAAAWHPNPDGAGLRYWNGERWTESYHPGNVLSDAAEGKEVLWALSLGFGVAGGLPAAVGMPVLGFYFPLGLGAAGLALAIAAFSSSRGSTPWYAAVAVIAAVIAVLAGVDGLNQFNDASDSLSGLGS